MNPLMFHPLNGLTEADRLACKFHCYESDGAGGGGGLFDSISKFFGGGGGSDAAATITKVGSTAFDPSGPIPFTAIPGMETAGSVAGAFPSTGFDTTVGTQDVSAAAPALNLANQGGGSPAPIPASGSSATPTLESPGPGVGAVAGPGGGAAASAAPSSIDPNAATRGITVGGAVQPAQTPGFTNTVAQNIDPAAISKSTGAGTGTSVDTLLSDPSMKNLMKTLGANANVILPAAGLGAQVLQSQKSPEGLDALRAAAERTSQQSAAMQQYLQTGTLPPGLQAGLDSAREAAKASIRARYAGLPGSSSAMEQELAAADQTAAAKGGELALQLFQQGMSESQISNGLYEAILQQDLERDKELGSAMGNFTTALAGGGPHVSLNIGGR